MQISTKYDPAKVESKWYEHWMGKNYYHSEPDDRKPYTIVIPPPNVTGVLHMGHMLNNTIQDVLIRRARLMGYNACWVPGTDHASIATEAKVVRKLREEGIKKSSLSREKFLNHAWDWTDKHGGIILEQLKKLGASCDWERTRFTMEDNMSAQVIKVFVDLHDKGYIYRGERMVNWDPVAKTALSDEEVIHKEINSKLYYVSYQIENSDETLTIATTRPETILGDTAICVNPSDKRYKHLKGKKVVVPLVERLVPVIEDDYVEIEFGTGALKVTPAHDENDYEIGKRHSLSVINVLNDDGTMSEEAQFFVGKDRFEARKLIVKELEKKGHLQKVEALVNKVGYSERTDAVIEPKISLQWFVSMKEISKPALENVMNDKIRFFPSKFKNMYRHWMENVRDWCISRQLWWGQRIPAWYLPGGDYVVAETAGEALKKARELTNNPQLAMDQLRQDEDVVDTWFSSWLWPISVFDGLLDPENKEIQYYYPTTTLVTAPEIIFFWVARMVIAGYEYRDEQPFKNVYFTGIVRDEQGRKMSKSLGNSPEPLELIKQYGADGVRVGMLFSSPAGNDLLFDEKLCEQGRNFSNKIWNAMRLVKGWEIKAGQNEENLPAIDWFKAKQAQVLKEVERAFDNSNLSEALKTIYSFIWDDFCSWYLEMVKPDYQQPIDRATYEQTVDFFEEVVALLHPYMPFITEEIWHTLREREEGNDLIIGQWPHVSEFAPEDLHQGETAKFIISHVRDVRNKNNLKQREPVSLYILSNKKEYYKRFLPLIKKLAFLDKLEFTSEEQEGAVPFLANKDKFFARFEQEIDKGQEQERLQKELEYTAGFIQSIEKKLNNERFVNNAPAEVVDRERMKLEDGREKVRSIREALERLK